MKKIMRILQAYRYELKPNNAHKTLLAKHAGAARFAWNWGLARRLEQLQTTEGQERFPNAIEQHREWNHWKQEHAPWAYEVSKCAPQEALRDLDRAFATFWNARKMGREVGFPKFKKKGVHDSFRLTGACRVYARAVRLPRLGRIRTKECTDLKGRILSATVSTEANRWYVSFTVERERPASTPATEDVVGIDVGLTPFATLSTGEIIVAPKPLQRSLRLLRRRSRQHARKQKGSQNRKKSALRLTQLHRRIRHQRTDFLHKTTTRLAKTKAVLVVEDLHVRGMMRNPHLARHIADVGWSTFRRMLAYKTQWYGSTLIVAPAFWPSSKRCSNCGHICAHLPLHIREWTCLRCSAVHGRDLNAALNLQHFATASSAGSHACGDLSDGGTDMRLVYESRIVEAGSERCLSPGGING